MKEKILKKMKMLMSMMIVMKALILETMEDASTVEGQRRLRVPRCNPLSPLAGRRPCWATTGTYAESMKKNQSGPSDLMLRVSLVLTTQG